MIELYIEDSLVELTDDIIINQTYETLDPEKLSSIKNSFSKTVDIQGTPNNNKLFGDIFRIDRYIPARISPDVYGRTSNKNYQYDPHKKANYLLMKNGSVVNRGYCTLDNIVIKSDTLVTYKLTLYGGIGEFFYSLAYNEDGSPKTLYDMHWAWKRRNAETPTIYDDPMTPEQEDNNIIMDCTTRNINMAYHLLKPLETIYYDGETYEHWGESGWWYDDNTAYHITDIDKDVVFVPCYTGTYEDFDSKKMLISTFNQNYNPGIGNNFMTQDTKNLLFKSFPDQIIDYSEDPDNPTVYTTLDKNLSSTSSYRYGIASFSRDLDPWEAGDIRLNEMPVAIRLSKLMRTLSEPFNNGGYEVEWNQEILDSPYWNYSWVMLGKMKQDKESFYEQLSVTANEFNSKYVSLHYKNEENYKNGAISTISQSETNYGDEYEIFNDNLKDENYSFTISLKPIAEFNVNPGTFNASNIDNLFNGWYYFHPGTPGHSSGNHYVPGVPPVHRCRYNYPTLVYNVYEEGILKYSCAFAFFLTNLLRSDQLYLQPSTSFKSNLEEFLGHTINQIKIYKVPVEVLSITSTSIYDHIKIIAKDIVDCEFNIPGNISGNITVKQQFVLTSTGTDRIIINPGGGLSNAGFVWGYNSFEPATTPDTFFAFTRDAWPALTNSNTNNVFTYSFSLEKLDEIGISTINTTGFNTLKLTKKMLFAESKSPLKYLADLIKMMNWRVTADNMTKKIYIDPLKKFYKGRILDINDKVDYNRDISIKNITTTSKRINFGLENLETYPISLFNRINRDKFNIYHYDTGIEYNTSETGLLDNLIYKSTLDWQQNSIFYNIIKSNTGDGYESGQFPKAYNTPTISWTLFNIDEYDPNDREGSIKRFEKIVPGCSSNPENLLASNDWLPKISLFNKESKFVEPDTVLMFLNGFVANYDYYKVEESETNSYYSVFPRFSISEDTYEQYYFCNGRCYVYDFKYNDTMTDWGMYSSDQKGTAFSCAMPFFTRELYNLYESDVQTDTVTLQPTQVWNNQYFSYENGTYYIHQDTNWEMRRYDIDQSTMSNLKFTAHYPVDQTGYVLIKFASYGGVIGTEGTFGSAQHDFVDSSINISNGVSYIYMNVWKGNTDTTYITADIETTLPPEWRYKNEIIASWNLVGQDNILSMYNLDKARFLTNPEKIFLKRPNSSQKTLIDNNEYIVSLPTFMPNTIFDNNWRDYMNDLYDRNTRDVTLYIDLSSYGNPNEIMRTIFQWQGFYWIPMKIENFKTSDIGQDKFTKCTIHKIKDISTWLE